MEERSGELAERGDSKMVQGPQAKALKSAKHPRKPPARSAGTPHLSRGFRGPLHNKPADVLRQQVENLRSKFPTGAYRLAWGPVESKVRPTGWTGVSSQSREAEGTEGARARRQEERSPVGLEPGVTVRQAPGDVTALS